VTAVNPAGETARVGVVILNWNGFDLTRRCVETVLASDHPGTIPVVVDNDSADGSFQRLREAFPDVAVLQSGANLGYAGGNNVGIRRALADGAEFVFVINNDTEVPPDCVGILVEEMRRDPRIGLAGPRVIDAIQDCIGAVGGTIHWPTAEPRQIGCMEADRGQYRDVADVEFVPGTAVMARREALEQVGEMPERYFMYFEDVAWSLAFRRAGWRTVAVPRAHLLHFESSSAGRHSPLKTYFQVRNNLAFVDEWVPAGERRAVGLRFRLKLAKLAAKAVLARSAPQLRAIIAGYRDHAAGRMDNPGRRF
jgi:GT2 family glycosyltransferase